MQARAVAPGDFQAHLRLAHLEEGTLVGSAWGRAFWRTETASDFVQALLKVSEVQTRFGNDKESWILRELEGRTTGLIMESLASGGVVADDAIEVLLSELTATRTEAYAAWLVRDLDVAGTVHVSPWLLIEPASEPVLNQLTKNRQHGVLTVPKGTSAVLVAQAAAAEGAIGPSDGPFLGMTSIASAQLAVMGLRDAVWILTGSLSHPTTRVAGELARFPAVREIEEHGTNLEPGLQSEQGHVHPSDAATLRWLTGLLYARPWFDGDDATRIALSTATGLASSGHAQADGLAANLLCYAGLDALLSGRRDEDSRTPARLRALVGGLSTVPKLLSRRVHSMYGLRGELAHGRRPSDEDVRVALELEAVEDELTRRPYPLHVQLGQSGLRYLRAALAATLAVCYQQEGEEPFPGVWTQRYSVIELRDMLESSLQNDREATAKLESLIPAWVQTPLEEPKLRNVPSS